MKTLKEYFGRMLLKSGIEADRNKIDKIFEFLDLLYEKNKVMNLTAIRDKEGMLEKHFIDSLLLTRIIDKEEEKIIDIGTGAGFPGLVLAIYYPEKQFLLVDSVKKKIGFIKEVLGALDLKNVDVSPERAEEIIKGKREYFDVALCRGVGNLRIIIEYMLPFLKVRGRFLPQKLNADEVEEAGNALKIIGGEVKDIHIFHLPVSGDRRTVIEIVKNKMTDKKYPRKTGIPAKNPL